MKLTIPVMKPKLPDFNSVIAYLKSMDSTAIYSNRGPLLKKLEERFAENLQVSPEEVVLCANATLAIQGLCELSPAEEFKVPAFTFAATGLAVQKSGKKLGLLDIDADSWEIDISQNKLDRSTGVVPVAPFGKTLNLDKYLGIENVIVDAAASLGSYLQNPVKLEKNQSIVFSLHATKVLGIGEGGLVLFGDANKAQEFRTWLNFGFSGSRDSLILGTNAKMSEIQAAYGHAVLDHWEEEKNEWLDVRAKVKRVESELPAFFQIEKDLQISPYWLSYSSLDFKQEIQKSLDYSGIESRDWWSKGLHRMPAFQYFKNENFSNTDKVVDSLIGLPFYRGLSDSEVCEIYKALSRVVA